MKQTNPSVFYDHTWGIGKILGMIFLLLTNLSSNAAPVTSSIVVQGIRLTISYDNVVCLGSENTITYTLENTNTTPFANNIRVLGFTPDGTQPESSGLAFVSAVAPQPAAVVSFDPTAPFTPCPFCVNCVPGPGIAAPGIGEWVVSSGAQPFVNGIPFSFTITYQATACGAQSFYGQLQTGSVGLFGCLSDCSCFDVISILVIPYATFQGANAFFTCQDSDGFTGTLFPPSCFPPDNCTGAATGCSDNPFHFIITDSEGGTATLLDPTGGIFEFIPNGGFSGNGSITYNVVSDTIPPAFCSPTAGNGVAITVISTPSFSPLTVTGCAGQTVTGSVTGTATGGVPPYSFSLAGPATCGSASITPAGIFTYTAPTGPGGFACTFDVLITDSFIPCTGIGTVTVSINATPIPTNQTLQTCVNTPLSGTLTATGGTPPYTFAIASAPSNGIISSFDPNTGDFVYTPNLNFTGSDSFTFNATDSAGCTSSVVGTITINVNPQPITSSTAVNGCQSTTLTGNLVPLVTGGTGPFEFSPTGPAPSCGSISIDSSGFFAFVPNTFFTGCCDFQYQVLQGGCPGTGPNTVTVCISPAPVATGGTFNVCQFGNVTGDLNDFLLSSTGTTSFTAVGGPTNGTLSLNPSGPFSFTASIASGVAGFNYRAISDILPCPSDVETITINVHQNPRTTTGTISACEETPRSGNLNPLVSGSSPFTFTGPLSETNGTTIINVNGGFTFTPDPGVTGGSFTFGVTDVFGCTAVGTELITVNPSPTASDQTATGCSNAQATGSLAGVVSGGTPGYIFSVQPPVVNGMVILSQAGVYSFTPNAGATAGSFGFQATDTRGCIATGTVNVTINPAPIASTGLFTGCNNGFTGSLASLVTGVNPPFTFSGPIGAVSGGTVTVDASGNFFFNPNITEGVGSFNFQATDSGVPPCTTNVTPVNVVIEEGPIALLANYDACQDTPLIVSAASGLANFVTGGFPPFTFFQTGATPPCAASITVNPDGSFSFTPAPAFAGVCDFNWQVLDSTPCASNVSTGSINVHPTPIADDVGPSGACQLVPTTGDLNDFMSVGTPPYTFTGGNAINGTINYLLPTGPFSFTPILVGLASFDYSAIDSFGCQSNTGTVSFNVAESPVVTSPSPLEVCQLSSVTSIAVAAGSPVLFPVTFSITATVNGSAVINPVTGVFTFTPNVVDFPTPTVMGSVTIRATAAAPSVCFGETTVIINIHQNPLINITGLGSCTGTFTGSLAPFVTGGVPPYIFGPAGVVPTTPPGCGTVVLDVFGDFIFTANPPSAFPCPCSFEFTVTESSVSSCTTTGTVAVCVNQPPFANDVNTCQCANVPLALNLSAFVTGGLPPFTFSIVGVPIGGTVLLLNATTGLVIFIPTPGFNGFASFQYQVTDSNNPACVSNIGTVTIQVPCCPPTSIPLT